MGRLGTLWVRPTGPETEETPPQSGRVQQRPPDDFSVGTTLGRGYRSERTLQRLLGTGVKGGEEGPRWSEDRELQTTGPGNSQATSDRVSSTRYKWVSSVRLRQGAQTMYDTRFQLIWPLIFLSTN